jgi:hypothetical protein
MAIQAPWKKRASVSPAPRQMEDRRQEMKGQSPEILAIFLHPPVFRLLSSL